MTASGFAGSSKDGVYARDGGGIEVVRKSAASGSWGRGHPVGPHVIVPQRIDRSRQATAQSELSDNHMMAHFREKLVLLEERACAVAVT